jgi:glycerate kinase
VRVLLAPSGSLAGLGPAAAAAALADGWRRTAPGDVLDLAPLSEGGAGLVDALAAVRPAAVRLPVQVEDPLARPVTADVLLDGGTAWVEAAAACGLHRLAPDERHPRRRPATASGSSSGPLSTPAPAASSWASAARCRTTRSSTAARACSPRSGSAASTPPGNGCGPAVPALRDLARLVGAPDPRLAEVELVVATGAELPLLGLRGTCATTGPAKGASREEVALLDGALTRWADALEQHLGVAVRDRPGAGAAGGTGAALLALGATVEPAVPLLLAAAGLPDRVAQVDLVVTGEQRYDLASMSGAVGAVTRLAAEHALPVLVLAGEVRVGRREAGAAGVEATWALEGASGAAALADLAARVAGQWSR